ncbi:MBL fold metallo-hydrolase [Roseomonas sp. OT10]|uniref:MBL fold metallo-hydrolase n=1 Tax=Roseomonas cutis TaxID=2897332 RepID=UPI001E5A628B|nr:MBL fold metallo-hydrolase [Roseomonas sp. OT10]UFN50357.1 MBL fold metallo-hydrolase [Roseomonas sp. OT10]
MSEAPPAGARRGPGGRFLNPDGGRAGQPWRAVWKLRREPPGPPWPEWVEDPPLPPPAEPPPGHVAVTFIGHDSFLIRFAGGPTLLTDPIWSARCSPLSFAGPKRHRAPALALEALPPIDAVLLSHNHYDHMDLPTLRALRAPRILTGLGCGAYLARKGIAGAEELDWWQESALPQGAMATYLPMRHFSARSFRDAGRMLWGGFAVTTRGGGRFFFAGDTAYGPHLAEIGARLGPFGVGLVPIGAYEPRWFMQVVHVDPEEAVRMRGDLRVRTAVAMHFGTFRLTREAIDAPVLGMEAAREAAGLPPDAFRVPAFGETLVLPM